MFLKYLDGHRLVGGTMDGLFDFAESTTADGFAGWGEGYSRR